MALAAAASELSFGIPETLTSVAGPRASVVLAHILPSGRCSVGYATPTPQLEKNDIPWVRSLYLLLRWAEGKVGITLPTHSLQATESDLSVASPSLTSILLLPAHEWCRWRVKEKGLIPATLDLAYSFPAYPALRMDVFSGPIMASPQDTPTREVTGHDMWISGTRSGCHFTSPDWIPKELNSRDDEIVKPPPQLVDVKGDCDSVVLSLTPQHQD
ncbi:hypothetical protein PISMIDRAFT_13982 [Pisolithus microcarpus 441]|uniref:Uncharacterized protein n=1 Tax=Pisolithus microcarpus 441 TaxID=765257 RepID=A0A0C9YR17_9AGAM|nr:hypothetical protein BKA83DRAFT_13982 [Pisolithus microcarpus]KIK19031.1 hypothetical protein PISMIDRAFT_13982 [Pisolithus microcarpus 441]